ncbi:VTC domain-containing protein [Dissophora ornata]|nr:vacuolar transporter chaperone [Dissophora ornata]KAI8604520.1 VTC domain-containing protein [Dissophora ornata]
MKFGSQLKAHWISHWRYHYVDYDGLKAQLKSKTSGKEFTEEDEVEFVKLLNTELEKVASFQSMKLGEVQRRTEHCEYTIRQHQLPSGKSSEKLTLASFVETESEINKVTQDLQDLARFRRLNYTAFLKIIKKHDKHSGFTLRAYFMNQQLNNQPFHKESFATLVSRLSCLYNIVRTGTAPAMSKADSEEDEELEHPGCIPKKTAFWVHPDNVMDLKMLILKYLPLVVYEPTSALDSSNKSASQLSSYLASESPVSTVYLDNSDFDMYMGQIEHREQSETVRLRWYGSEKKYMCVEQQQRSMSQAATGSSSAESSSSTSVPTLDEPIITKHRFQIKSKYVPKLLQGAAKMNKAVEQMRRSGQKTEQEIKQFEELTRIVQSRIKKRQLQPVVQTFFNRTAFQVPGDTRVRITIDTDVVMVRERAIVSTDLFDRPWSPTDLQAEDYPFSQIREQDIVRFPYAIMQIRTLTEPQEEIPSWADHIAQSHLVEMVPNFAKDLHAAATLYESRVGLLPFWLSDMDRDIRKPAMLTGGFPHRSTLQDSNSNFGSNDSLASGQSTAATTISDSGSPSSLQSLFQGSTKGGSGKKPSRSRKDLTDSSGVYTPNVTFHEEVQDLVAVNKMMLERQGNGRASTVPKMKQPVVSCLKKPGSLTSIQGRNSSNEDLHSQQGSEGYGSTTSSTSSSLSARRRKKRVSFKKSTARKWLNKVQSWIPYMHRDGHHISDDIEAQYFYARRSPTRSTINRLFWTGLSSANIALLFVGLVLALMNLGDGVGLEAASLFLVISCLCMGTTVWAHLIRMDGHESSSTLSDEEDVAPYMTKRSNELSGLLSSQVHSSQYAHAGHRGRWVRTRLMPVVMFLCLVTVVGLNAAVVMRPINEEVGTD